ncbi:MAG: NAD-dependent ligase adenylation domain, partial [Bacteroidota bacterium]
MYNKEQIQALQSVTKDFLQNPHYIDLTSLKQVLKFHEYQYYVSANPLISDYEYDN